VGREETPEGLKPELNGAYMARPFGFPQGKLKSCPPDETEI